MFGVSRSFIKFIGLCVNLRGHPLGHDFTHDDDDDDENRFVFRDFPLFSLFSH